MPRTLIMFKPDAHERDLCGKLCDLLGDYNLKILRTRCVEKSDELTRMIQQHYTEHIERPFYPYLVDQMPRGPVTVCECEGTVDDGRKYTEIMREKYRVNITNNTVHASDSPESAQREIELWFSQ